MTNEPTNTDQHREWLEAQISFWVENKKLGRLPPPLPQMPRFLAGAEVGRE